MQRIRASLAEMGFPCWLDVNMDDLSTAAMQEAVQNSVRAYDAGKTLQSKWSGEVVSASLGLSLECNLGGNPPRNMFQGELQTPKLTMIR